MSKIILYVKTLQPHEVSLPNEYINSIIVKTWPIHEQRQLVGNTLISIGCSMVVICVYLKLYMYLRYERDTTKSWS